MNLMPDEKILMEGDYKQVILTTHRIRQENKAWGKIDLVSIMLEHITSCEYTKKSKPIFLVSGIILLGLAFYLGADGGSDAKNISIILLAISVLIITFYFLTIKRGLFISSASAKITIDTKGMKDENIKTFIDKIEVAKSERQIKTSSNI